MKAAALVALLWAAPAAAEGIVAASFGDPTSRYPHGVLGDLIEWGSLRMETVAGAEVTITLPESRVFEDTAPRLADVDQDGNAEVVVIESDARQGARLSVYDASGLIASNDFIGRSFRWLAPVAIADLDGDGQVELAYVDRPHLAKTLRVFRYQPGKLEERARFAGVTNHRIGEADIAGGLRLCGNGPEMIVANAAWTRLLALQFDGTDITATDIGPHIGRSSFAEALAC